MSAISNFINTIRNAIYGEQVREAIADAIEQCYDDVSSPALNTAAFATAIANAYAGGFLDIQEKSTIAGMTNQKIIYRYTGTETGYIQNALYFHNGTEWKPIGDVSTVEAKMVNVIGALDCIQKMLNRGVFTGDIAESSTELRRYMSALIGDEDDGISYINRASATSGVSFDIGVSVNQAYYLTVNAQNNGNAAYKMLFSTSETGASSAYLGFATASIASTLSLQNGTKYRQGYASGEEISLNQNDTGASTRTVSTDGSEHIVYVNNPCYIKRILMENNEGEMILDLRPCVDENETVCFYDKVSEEYIYNTGSGSLVEG